MKNLILAMIFLAITSPLVDHPEGFSFAQEDIDLMARVVMSETSTQPFDAKQAVASVILNRYFSDKYPDTISEVIFQPKQFSTADNGIPNQDCYDAVEAAIEYRDAFPPDMYWFRSGKYHSEKPGKRYNYIQIKNMYFSTESDTENIILEGYEIYE